MKSIFKRRLNSKTDYKARLVMLKSGKTRIVVRKTNRYIIAQAVQTDISQDKVLALVSSKELLIEGMKPGSLKNLNASYQTGILLAKKIPDIKEAILDIGLNRNIPKSRLYAVLKGLLDAKIKIPHKPDSLPIINNKTSKKIESEETNFESKKPQKSDNILKNKIIKEKQK